MKTCTISEFKAHLSESLREVRKGEHFIILDRDKPFAEVIPIPADKTPGRFDSAKKPYKIPPLPSISIQSSVEDLLEMERGEI